MDFKRLSTKDKALKINLDNTIYGSLAEIGAGQEVAANFFKAGGASGTIAKTMSAYAMAFSDAIYGPEKSGRYVCQSRLEKMLHREYSLLEKRLPEKAANTRFFAFADTIEALNYNRTNEGHGWLGLKFQLTPQSEPNLCVIHVKLKDNDPIIQQQTIGIIGVNLIYACFYHSNDPEELMLSFMDELNKHKLQVDFFSLTGPDFKIDNRLFSLKLVKHGLSKATMFGPDGNLMMPADVLYKKNILVLRGRFRPITHINLDMMERSLEQFKQEPDVDPDNIITIAELTLNNLRVKNQDIDEQDFLDRVDLLTSMGHTVLISNYQEYYRLTNYLSRFTRGRKIGVTIGVYNLEYIFNEEYYKNLKGGILEAFGYLFGRNVKMFVYPSYRRTVEGTDNSLILTGDDIALSPHLKNLFQTMKDMNKIENLEGCNTEHLHIISDEIIAKIQNNEEGWEEMIPDVIVKQIKEKCLFQYPKPKPIMNLE
ncbi:nicotinate-nucleotide adenylyltransferase [Sediminitomix flava]|uniref:Nicotinamide mononucleotide adenylyltransferase n=1 Tax=Sediminitomix flava TaxID=379075 RepID=A0A315ZD49_SEDFL|nr:nicotinate-nucleotide adenylyltransferase [Sediminitomix flava]PWJ43033.1 hypothetical protein BC781_102580 [Sediminitomix flava]